MDNRLNELYHFGDWLAKEGFVFSSPACRTHVADTKLDLSVAMAFVVEHGHNLHFAQMDQWNHPHAGLEIGITSQDARRVPMAVKEYISEQYGMPILTHWQILINQKPHAEDELESQL